MKKLLPIAIIVSMIFLSFSGGVFNHFEKYGSGSPAGYSGDPASSFQTCTSCHSGPSAINQTGWITSNVPVNGYIPGTSYTITATATRPGHSRFGFQISPQNPAGTLLGSMANLTAQTQINGAGKYITHTSSGTTGSGSKTWSFTWTAPPAGSGTVTFYGAFNVTNNQSNSSGDTIFTSTLAVNENVMASTAENGNEMFSYRIYPNPLSDLLNIYFSLKENAVVEISIYDLTGKQVAEVMSDSKQAGDYNISFPVNEKLRSGVYMMYSKVGASSYISKIIVQ